MINSKPRIALFIGIICISIFPIIVKLNATPSLVSAFYRMAIAAAFVVPYAFFTKQLKRYNTKTMMLIVLCGICFGSDIAVWNYAIQGSSATQATLLTNLAPVWVGIGSYVFLKIKPLISLIAKSPFTGFGWYGWGTLLIQGIVCQLIAWLLISYSTKNMRATRVSLSLLSQAVLAALLAWYFLGEAITYQMILGGVIILIGIGITFIEKPLIKK